MKTETTTTETTTTNEITHLGVTAPLSVWELLGYRQSAYRTDAPVEAKSHYTHIDREETARLDSLVLQGLAATARADSTAIAWALSEQNRRGEEKARSRSIAIEAEALITLAKAIREGGEEATLERIIGRLSERTQYAVRSQLSKNA